VQELDFKLVDFFYTHSTEISDYLVGVKLVIVEFVNEQECCED
jgi:hypothetical protein